MHMALDAELPKLATPQGESGLLWKITDFQALDPLSQFFARKCIRNKPFNRSYESARVVGVARSGAGAKGMKV